MIRLLKGIYHIIRRLYYPIRQEYKQLFYFILPNLSFLCSGRLNKESLPKCDQKTFLTGPGTIKIGKNCSFGYKPGGFHRGGSVELQTRHNHAIIKIGNNVSTNNNIFLCAADYIEIGDDTLIGQYVTIMDFESHGTEPEKRRQIGEVGKIIIADNVWIGNNVVILKNSEIGNNTIIAAGAIVSGKFPADVIIGGIPAKIIKSI